MFSMRTIALKLFRAAWTNVLTSISIITISICLVMTMSVYIWNANTQMKEDIQALFGEMDLMVGYNTGQPQVLTNEQISNFVSTYGVTKVSSVLLAHTIVENANDTYFYTAGVENDDLVKSRYHFSVDLAPNDVVITENVAQIFNKEVGDTLQITFNKKDGDSVVANKGEFIIQEILQPIKGTESMSLILLQNDVLKPWMDYINNPSGMYWLIKTDGDVKTVGTELKQLDETLRVDVTSEYDFYQENLQSLMIFMIVLSLFILLISSVLLMSTFQLLFYKIKEQLMVLRALGATKKQVGRIVQLQLSLIVSFGVLLGTAVSLLVVKFWLPQLINIMKLPSARTELPMLFVLIIAASSLILLHLITQWQVRKSTRLLPLQIASDNENLSLQWTKWKAIAVSSVSVIALLLFLNSLVMVDESGGGKSALMLLIGTLLTCGVLLYLMPYLFTTILNISLKPIRKAFGKEAFLACQQLMPQVRKNMPIVISIIGLMIILIFSSSLFKTIQQSGNEYINSQYETPIKLTNELYDPTITPALIKEIESLPSVSYAFEQSHPDWIALQFENDWHGEDVEAIDIQKYIQLGKLDSIEGEFTDGVLITERFAKQHQLTVGDRLITGEFDETIQQTVHTGELQVIGIRPTPSKYGANLYVDWSSNLFALEPPIITEIMVEATDSQLALAELAYLEDRWPALKISDKATIIEQNDEATFQRWSLFVGVFIILIVATCLGVLQTLLHSVYAKRSDYAIQRLIGLSPNGLMKLILTQVMSFVLYGLTVGTFLGILLTRMLAFIDEVPPTYDFLTLGITCLIFLLATIVVFTLQGYWISRKKLANEIIDM